ncbi:glycosyltransferase family 4 protein [Candidatus Roizmanbacteria bacterium]|nr:glycosyltransferase family 4 protein [Candidatus Roizmanbacteria bacterium]
MKIAQIAPLIERVPPKKYGGTERIVHVLTEELVKRGHDVTLFASGDSITSGKLISIYPRGLREARVKDLYAFNELQLYNSGNAYQMQQNFDIIHDHNGYLSIQTANIASVPSVFTLHGPLNLNQKRMYSTFRNPYLVSISKAQVRTSFDLNIIDTIYHGLPMEDYPFSDTPEDYLLFVGRISMDKGLHYAIEVALSVDKPLIIAAKLDQNDRKYFDDFIEPQLSDDRIRWIGEVNEDERNNLMDKALCVLHPITFREPFGLTMIEALACGCPVVAFNRGSVPEIIIDGQTGFVVSDIEEMTEAVARLGEINRVECRRHALENFNSTTMVDKYEAVYKKILSTTK